MRQWEGQLLSVRRTSRQGRYVDSGPFEQRYTELVAELRDHLEEFDQLGVPQSFIVAHNKISHSHKTAYEALAVLRSGFMDRGQSREALYARARTLLATACREDLDAEREARRRLP